VGRRVDSIDQKNAIVADLKIGFKDALAIPSSHLLKDYNYKNGKWSFYQIYIFPIKSISNVTTFTTKVQFSHLYLLAVTYSTITVTKANSILHVFFMVTNITTHKF